MKVEGRCHCGAISYEAEVQPDTITICHCADCQMQSGTAFRANVPAAAKDFRILSGIPKQYLKTTPNGTRRIHAFCETCGSPVYSSAEINPQKYSLRIGTLDQRYALGRPALQQWTKRRFAWLPPLDGVEEIDVQK